MDQMKVENWLGAIVAQIVLAAKDERLFGRQVLLHLMVTPGLILALCLLPVYETMHKVLFLVSLSSPSLQSQMRNLRKELNASVPGFGKICPVHDLGETRAHC